MIPLNRLIPSPANVRKTGTGIGVEELAALKLLAQRKQMSWLAEIAGRFGCTPAVVRQRLKLAAAPPPDGGLPRR